MMRLLAVLVSVALAIGCQHQRTSGVDPFFGHTRVQAPGTGAVVAGTSDPYYNTAPYGAVTSPVSPITPNPTPLASPAQPVTSGDRGYAPPDGSFRYQGSSWTPVGDSDGAVTRVESAALALSERSLPSASEPDTSWADRERVVQVLHPRSRTAEGTGEIRIPAAVLPSSSGEPPLLRTSSEAVEITDLPPATRSGVSTWTGSPSSDRVRLASSALDSSRGETTTFSPVQSSASDGYGYDPDYRWLRGRLEYSQLDRQWKLRYIAATDTLDSHGGSVILPEGKLPTGCERGDFLEVTGHMRRQAGVAPTYEVVDVRWIR